jgi:hypothetical protein
MPEAAMKQTRIVKVLVLFAVGFAIAAATPRAFAGDDWEQIDTPSAAGANYSSTSTATTSPAHSPHRGTGRPAPKEGAGVAVACGEKAVPASAKIQSIVSQINGAWGSDVHVYQSVAVEGPHAMPGGCIFYNPTGLAMLLGLRLNLTNPDVLVPMLYAIFAHEVGHEVHLDFDPSRNAVPDEVKELEADRFAGYTMEKLDVPATGLSPYWSMTGDEFGAGTKHGSSAQRVAAFKEGWHEAEWNRAENSKSVTVATEEPVAPEDSAEAP